MSTLVRPVADSDYPRLAECNEAAMPGADDTGESLRNEDGLCAAFERFVAEVDGEVAGHASWFQLPSRFHPQKFWMDGCVNPRFQRRGVATALLNRILEAIAPKAPILLRTASREDFPGGRPFLLRQGFAEAKRTWESFLDLSSFDFGPYKGLPEAVESQGIRLVQLTALQSEAGWDERLRELYNAIQADVPDIDPAAQVSAEQFTKSYLGSPDFMPEGHFIALEGDGWVGLSTLWRGSRPERVDTGLTGTLSDYRRRSIALALKLRSLAWAREQGVTSVRTTNASTNAGMLAINDRLGFQRRPAWIHFVRHF